MMAIAGMALGLLSPVWPMWFASSMSKVNKADAAERADGKKRLEANRSACAKPNAFRIKESSPFSNAPEFQTDADWECVTPEQVAAEAERARAKAKEEEQRAKVARWEADRYETIDSIKVAGAAAMNKLGHMRFRRGRTDSDHFVAYPCEGAAGLVWAELTFTREQAPAVLALSDSRCTFVDFAITGQTPFGNVAGRLYRIP
jgi:hypothetical protein